MDWGQADLTEWANSDEGKQAMADAAEQADKLIRYLRKEREVDRCRMNEPMTI